MILLVIVAQDETSVKVATDFGWVTSMRRCALRASSARQWCMNGLPGERGHTRKCWVAHESELAHSQLRVLHEPLAGG